MDDSARNTHVFVIYCWTEPRSDGPGSRRGYVEHVSSRERRYFAEIDEALAFVNARARGDTAT